MVFFDAAARWGPYGRVFGLVLMAGYLGAGASVATTGRTIGKRLWDLEVRRIGGGHLAIAPAIARAMILSLPYLANGWGAKEVLLNPVLAYGLALVTFILSGSILYLFLFNRTTGQSLHDLVVGTVVVKAGGPVPTKQPPIAPVHFIAMAGIGVLAICLIVVGSMVQRAFQGSLAQQQALWATLSADPRFFSVGVNHNTLVGGPQPTTTVSIEVWLKDLHSDRHMVMQELAAKVLDHYKAAEPNNVAIRLTRAYDLGVASWQLTDVEAASAADWRQRAATPNMRLQPSAAGREP